MVNSQSSTFFTFLQNKLQFIMYPVSCPFSVFFFLSIKSFSLSLTFTFVGLLMMLFLFLLSFSLTLCSLSFSASTCQHFLFPKHSLPALLTMHALLYIMATCGGLLQSMPGMCCLGMAGMHEAIGWNVNAFLLSLCRMSFLILAPAKCCWCSNVFRFHGSRSHTFMTFSSVA